MKEKKVSKWMSEHKMSIFVIVSAVVMLIGLSYAWLQLTLRGEREINIFAAGTLQLELDDTMTNGIRVENAVPITDEEGKAQTAYTFTLTNKGTVDSDYTIYLDDLDLEEGQTRMPDDCIKYQLIKDGKEVSLDLLSTTGDNPNRIFETGNIAAKKTYHYELRVWIDYNAGNEVMGTRFRGQLRIEATQAVNTINPPKMDENMIPVVYNETSSNWEKASNDNWYNYNAGKWANAVTLGKNKIFDSSSNHNAGTINGGKKLSDSIELDGEDDFFDCGYANYNFKNKMTYVLRFQLLSQPTKNVVFIGNQEAGGSVIAYNNNSKSIVFQLYSNEESAYQNVSVQTNFELNKYYTVVATYDGNVMRLYLNGKEIGNKTVSLTIKETPVPIAIGGNPEINGTAINNSNIKVSDALTFDKEISQGEVEKNYSTTVSLGSTKPLFYYNFAKENKVENGSVIPMDAIETMWVWIPRYSYTIASEDGTNYYGKQGEYLSAAPTQALPGEIDVKFVNQRQKDKGNAQYKVSEGVSGWRTPDAFTFGSDELSGIWVGKFETSSSNPSAENGGGNTTGLDAMIKPNVASWRFIQVANLAEVSRNVTRNNNRYGFGTTLDSHAMKNSEWAVVSYLSQSKYGKLGNKDYSGANKEIYQNKSNQFITGCSYGAPSNSNTDYGCQYTYDIKGQGTGASTTGTIYGIYDMSGGSWEYVMGVYALNGNKYSGTGLGDDKGINGNSGYTGLLSDGTTFTGKDWLEAKYYNFYESSDFNNACNKKQCISHNYLETTNWYNDQAELIGEIYPWSVSGGDCFREVAGIFAYGGSYGSNIGNFSFRLVLS